jgi:ubiquinone/menaquinone biosynthesis C-methylase UbiE/uncharacterized protein YbaR (Trm112 family)
MIAPRNPNLWSILRCPVCKGGLSARREELACSACQKRYPIVLGIPDLRIYEDPLIPLEDDYRKGEKLQLEAERLSFADLVRYYWSLPTYPPTPQDLRQRFIRHVLTDEARIEGYKEKLGSGESFLEVGCGTAALVKVAQERFELAVGCDVAFRWLVVARKRLQEAGLPANLVCCCADYLPFPDRLFTSVASVSLLEHVSDGGAAINEFGRVSQQAGSVFVWTSNRFSLAPEPHVRVWGVGFLPRRWMPAYVKWMRGLAYEKKHLLSCFEIRRLLKRAGLEWIDFSLPAITAADWESLRGLERLGALLFSRAARIGFIRRALVMVSPVILVVARRRDPGAAQSRPAPLHTMDAAK